MSWWKTVAWFAAGAYVVDVVIRPALVARAAQAEGARRGKPVLNVGAGTPGTSLRVRLLGPTRWGDVNCDLAARREIACGPEMVCYCDVQRLPYPDKHFGAAIASHVLEHVPDPEAALRELHRVADVVYIVVPSWWAPHTWLHPGHLWYYQRSSGKFLRLRQAR